MLRSGRWWVAASLWLSATNVLAQTEEHNAAAGELDARLRREARLEWVVQAALHGSPVLAEAGSRARAATERASSSGRLPDPELKYEQWAVPLKRPYALDRADTLMFGLRQAFPAPGTRQARARMTAAESEISSAQRQVVERELVRRVRQAYFAYYAADRTLQLHQEHVELTEQMLAQLRSNYELGRGNQQDLLKGLVELSRLHSSVAEERQARDTNRYLLNTLMGRPTDAPLGPPVLAEGPFSTPPAARELDVQLADRRPELSAGRSAIRRSQAALEAAQYAARRPSLMVGADYWLMPTMDEAHAYGAMVSMSLPWLNPERRAEARAAQHNVRAERYAAEAVQRMASFELHQAAAGLDAAKTSFEVLERDLLPQAERSLDATRSSFAVGQTGLLAVLDALRSYYQVRLDHSRARARVMTQLAEVEFASGSKVFAAPSSEPLP
jgi:cobalt-zinc-cadmium efflux system outer membrane protein